MRHEKCISNFGVENILQQYKQCTYNVILRRCHEAIVVEKQ